MRDKFAGVKQRSFNPMSIPALSNKAREAVKDAFETMSDWRTEIADDNERNSKRVIEKMAVAAEALGTARPLLAPSGHPTSTLSTSGFDPQRTFQR